MTVFFLGMSISNALVRHIQSSSLLSQFHAKVSKIGWNLDVLSAANTCWRVFVLEIDIPKLLPYLWIPEGRWGFESAWFWFFCIFLFQCSCFCLSYSLTVIWITPNWLLFVFYYNCPVLFCSIHQCSLYSEDAFLPSPFCIEYFVLKKLSIFHYGFHKKQIKPTIYRRANRRTFKFW